MALYKAEYRLGTARSWTNKHLLAPLLTVAAICVAASVSQAQQPVNLAAGSTPQSSSAAYPRQTSAWEFAVTPYLWLPALRGTLDTPFSRVGERSFQLSAGTVFTDIDSFPVMLAGEARYGRFAIAGDLVYVGLRQDISTRDVLFDSGHARVVNTIATLLGLYRFVDAPQQAFEFGGGLRYWRFDEKLSLNAGLLPGAILRTTANWAEPVLAARYRAMLSPRFGITLYGDVGGFNAASSLSWQAVGSASYDATQSLTLQVGWRYLHIHKDRGDFGFRLGYNGPFLAATFRF